jgi:putative colanic acid biosynthesis acetyltransferase WcaF
MSGPADSFRPMGRGPVYSLGNKLERMAFGCVWLLLARFTPPPLHAWRVFLLRLFGARIGSGVRIYGSVKVWLPRNLEIGEGAIVGRGADLYNQGHIAIGPFCVISQRAFLCASTHVLSDPAFELVLRPVVLGRGCWVAAEAFVGPGVTMADGSVLAARGALFEDTRPMGVYIGNPAAWVKERRFAASGPASG